MAEEIKTILSIDVGNTPKNIKELKQQIKDLQDALVRTDDTTDEYKTTLNTLVASQQKLQSILRANKSEISGVEGSYNALNATMKSLQQQWKATGDEAERNRIGKTILDINNQLKELDSSIGNNQRKVGSYTEGVVDAFAQLKSEIKQYRSQLLTLEEGTEEYNNTLSKLGNAQFQLRDMTEKAKYSVNDLGEKFNTLNKVGQGVVGGFNAIQGVFALCGAESENLQKTMVKLQAGMSIVQGLQGMEGMIDSVNGLKIQFGGAINGVKKFIASLTGVKGAIAATGIGLLVVALGLLVQHWDSVVEAVEKYINKESAVDNANKRLTDSFNNLTNSIKENNDERAREIKIMEAEGATKKEVLEKQLNDEKENLKKIKASRAEMYKQIAHTEYNIENVTGFKYDKEKFEELKKTYEESGRLIEESNKKIKDLETDIKVENIKSTNAEKKRIEDANKGKLNALKQQRENELEIIKSSERESELALKSNEERELAILKDEYEEKKALYKKYGKDTKTLTDAYEKEKTEIENKYSNERIEKAKKEAQEKLAKDIESKTNTMDFEYTIGVATAEGKNNGSYQSQIEYNNKLIELEQERFARQQEIWQLELDNTLTSAERKLEIERELAIAEIELSNKVTQNTIANSELEKKSIEENKKKREQAVMASFAITSSTLKSIGGLFEEESKEAKGFAVAAATIDTFAAAIAAYKSAAEIPYVGFVMAPIAAAGAIAAGAAQVKSILSTNEKNGSGASLSTSIPATTNPIINQNDLAVGYTRNLLGNSEEERLNSDTRVYILESDIQESGQKVEIRENNTDF